MKPMSEILTIASSFHTAFVGSIDSRSFMCAALEQARRNGCLSKNEVKEGKKFIDSILDSFNADGRRRPSAFMSTCISRLIEEEPSDGLVVMIWEAVIRKCRYDEMLKKHGKSDLVSLLKLKMEKGKRDAFSGICVQADISVATMLLMKSWPEYSGISAYPVPCSNMRPSMAYHQLPLWEGEYGAARLRLLDFLIEKLTKELGYKKIPLGVKIKAKIMYYLKK